MYLYIKERIMHQRYSQWGISYLFSADSHLPIPIGRLYLSGLPFGIPGTYFPASTRSLSPE